MSDVHFFRCPSVNKKIPDGIYCPSGKGAYSLCHPRLADSGKLPAASAGVEGLLGNDVEKPFRRNIVTVTGPGTADPSR